MWETTAIFAKVEILLDMKKIVTLHAKILFNKKFFFCSKIFRQYQQHLSKNNKEFPDIKV